MKNRRNLIIAGVVILLLVVGGMVYVLSSRNSSPTQISVSEEEEVVVEPIDPEEIGLTLTSLMDGKKVLMQVENTDDIQSLEYELSYHSEGDIPRGAIGQVTVKQGQPVRQEIVLGTCSDTCHYDTGVTDVKLIVKVTKTDGKVYQAEVAL